MKIFSTGQIISKLKEEGICFSNFSLINEGNYSTDDADWNYKDVPHLHHVHELAEAVFAVVGDNFIATINTQKFLGIKVPLALFNYQSSSNSQAYYTTWFFFTLIIETKYEEISSNRTKVTTTYNVGSPCFLRWCFPLIRWVLKRNYKNLMSTDIPMRERRGQLRAWGYTFHKDKTKYSFQDTMNIGKFNVIPPANAHCPKESAFNINEILPAAGECLFGRDDHLGLRFIRQNNELHIYPRSCPHEGASLDGQKCIDKKIKCPWHGRIFSPCAKFDLGNLSAQEIITKTYTFNLENETLKLSLNDGVA